MLKRKRKSKDQRSSTAMGKRMIADGMTHNTFDGSYESKNEKGRSKSALESSGFRKQKKSVQTKPKTYASGKNSNLQSNRKQDPPIKITQSFDLEKKQRGS